MGDVVEILRLGVIGLGFLLAMMAYRLLSQTMKQENVPSARYWAISGFMLFALAMSAIGLFSQFAQTGASPITGGIDQTEVQRDERAPEVRLQLRRTDLQQTKCIDQGEEALNRSAFTGRGRNDNTAWGYDRDNVGAVWCPANGGVAVFVVAGSEWEITESKLNNLVRGF